MSQGITFVTKQGISRVQAGLLALTFPLVLIGLALGVGFRQGGGVAEFGASFAAALMFLVAAPTAWVFAIDFIEAERFTVMLVGALTSLPLWALAGAGLARFSDTWRRWSIRYFAMCATWVALYVLVVGVVAAL